MRQKLTTSNTCVILITESADRQSSTSHFGAAVPPADSTCLTSIRLQVLGGVTEIMNYTQPHFARESRDLSPTSVLAPSTPPDPQSNAVKPTFSTARSLADLSASFTLLQQRYQQAGLADDDQDCLRVLPYHFCEATQVFVARTLKEVIGTVTLVGESEHPLPIFQTYPELTRRLKRRCGRIGEVTSLAISSHWSSKGEIFLGLTRLLTFFARHHQLDHLVAIVHPRHANFYRLAMGFEIIGNTKPCNSVGGNPGVAVVGSVNDRHCYRQPWRNVFFEGEFAPYCLAATPMSDVHANYFFDLKLSEHLSKAKKTSS